jgi:hypothetical protein
MLIRPGAKVRAWHPQAALARSPWTICRRKAVSSLEWQEIHDVPFEETPMRSLMKQALTFLSIVLLCIVGVVYSSAKEGTPPALAARPGIPNTSKAAIEAFWAAFHGNDYDAIPRVQAQIRRALRADPNNPALHALLGATHFWHIGEYKRDPNPNLDVLRQDYPMSVSHFQRALDLDYYGKHVLGYVNDDHLPGYLGVTAVHAGQQSNDPSLIAQGDRMLDFAVYQFPEFNNFNRWAAHNDDPKDSETYRKALDSMWQAIDSCIGGRIDRTHPDIESYLHLQTSVGRKKACWSRGDLASHSFEGLILNLGNGLVKAGQVDVARLVYANAQHADNYATWPYRQVLEGIAASDLNARAALYADADPSNDPSFGAPDRGCVYCHAKVPEPVR